MRLAAAALWIVAGCVDVEPQGPPEGDFYQYVVSDLRIPTNNGEAREFSVDLNADMTPDNQLGQVFALLYSEGLGVGETAKEALLRGGLVMLAELQTTAFDNTEATGFTMFLGSDPVPNACLDPARIDTCGQHLRGQGAFTIDGDSASHLAVGPIAHGIFRESMGVLPIEIAIDPARPMRLDLRGAGVKLGGISADGATAILGGAITRGDVETIVIPEAAAQIDRIVSADCGRTGTARCTCRNARAQTLRDLFDFDQDCRVDMEEVATNALVISLLSPEVHVHGQPMLSFGVSVDFVRATF